MLRFITDAPEFFVREIIAFARGVKVTTEDNDVLVSGTEESDIASVIKALASGGWKIAPWHPRPAISDPTFALAAAAIDREQGGNAAPAQAWR